MLFFWLFILLKLNTHVEMILISVAAQTTLDSKMVMDRIDMIISNNAEMVNLPRNRLQQQQQPSQVSSDPTSPSEVQIKQKTVDHHRQESRDSGLGWYMYNMYNAS